MTDDAIANLAQIRRHFFIINHAKVTLNLFGDDFAKFDFLFVADMLSVRDGLSAAEVAEHVAYTGVDIGSVALRSLVDRGLLERSLAPDARYTLTAAGRDSILHVLAAAKSVEEVLIDRLGVAEVVALRNLLKGAILASDPGLPKLWSAQPRAAGGGPPPGR